MIDTDNSLYIKSSLTSRIQSGDYLKKIQSVIHPRGGYCFSYKIRNQNQKLLLQCANGHLWRASASSIIYSKSWCPVCAGNHTLNIDEMKALARQRGGKCLSITYTNSKTKLLWQCDNGHIWYATPFSIKTRNSWCPTCVKMKKTIKAKK